MAKWHGEGNDPITCWLPETDAQRQTVFFSNNISAISCFNDRICGRWKVWESSPGKTLLSPSAARTCKRSTTRWTVNNSLSRCFKRRRPKNQMRTERHLWRWMNGKLETISERIAALLLSSSPSSRKCGQSLRMGIRETSGIFIPLCPHYITLIIAG